MKYLFSTRTIFVASLMFASAHQTFCTANLDQDYCELAKTYAQTKQPDKALDYYTNALRINPQNFTAAFGAAGILYAEKSDNAGAIEMYKKTVEIKPNCAEAHYNLGVCLNQEKRSTEALEAFAQATRHNPQYIKAYIQQGKIYQDQKKTKEAITLYQQALSADPNSFDAHYAIGTVYKHLDQFDEAIMHYRTATHLQPEHLGAMLELANTLAMFDNPQESLELYRKALTINPNLLSALYNLGYTLKKLGHINEAVTVLDKVLERRPDYALARFTRALSYLLLGDFERGWQEYEWRWQSYNEKPRAFKQPMWDGSDLAGKTILLYYEQGLGDTFQFIRYAQLLKQQGATIIFHTQKPLVQLLSLCPYLDKVVASVDNNLAFDFQLPLMSLPLLFKTSVDTVPASIPYLYADTSLVEQWRTKLANDKNFKIGICWQGNANYSTQFLRTTVAAKSMHVHHFEPLTTIKGISLYSIQKMFGTDQLDNLNPSLIIHTFGPDFDESHGRFMDTAAVIKNLDLVISIDTSICHLAAALGTPTWNLLPNPADWRWMIDRLDTPWYPNMRLFRQPQPGDWESVMRDVTAALSLLLANKQHKPESKLETPHTPAQPTHAQHNLADLVDQITMLSAHLTKATNKTTVQKLTEQLLPLKGSYEHYRRKHKDLDALTQQLLDINITLIQLELQLHATEQSVFTTDFATLARQAYYANNLKKHIKTVIEKLERGHHA